MTVEEIALCRKLRSEGMMYREIAEMLGRHADTIKRVIQKVDDAPQEVAPVPPRPAAILENRFIKPPSMAQLMAGRAPHMRPK